MTKSQLLATLAGSLLVAGLAVCDARAQATAPVTAAPRSRGVAVLDISYIFKNHLRFKREMEAMRADVQAAEDRFKRERDAIMGLREQLKELTPGTPSYKEMDQHVMKRAADLEAQLALQRKEFMLREARLYYTVYQEIQKEVEYYANSTGTYLVLRFNGDPVEPNQPDDVLRDINKAVIHYSRDIDITPIILERLNGGMHSAVVPGTNGRPMLPGPNYK